MQSKINIITARYGIVGKKHDMCADDISPSSVVAGNCAKIIKNFNEFESLPKFYKKHLNGDLENKKR